MKWWIAIILLQSLRVLAVVQNTPVTPKLQRCQYQKTFKMNGAFCSGLNLYYVPNTLKSSIEVLDMSFNRIRELKNTTFSRYTGLKYLYLADNMIQTIEPQTFASLTSLEALDLSLNAIRTIPEQVLNLPWLRKLYVSDNDLADLNSHLASMEKPFRAPLTFLNIANCKLKDFPEFGQFPHMKEMNVSGNAFKSLTPRNLAPFCSLTTLDLTGSFSFSERVCDNQPLINWFLNISKNTDIIPPLFSMFNPNGEDIKRCVDIPVDTEDIQIYDDCRAHLKTVEKEKSARQTWYIVAGCLGGFLVLAIVFLVYIHRRNVRQTKKQFSKNEIDKATNARLI